MPRPKVAFYWCASCGGCEETVVDLAEDILGVVEKVDIAFWPVALDFKKEDVERLPDRALAASFINGAVRTGEQEEMARLLRRKSLLVFAYGACAHLGGIPALANQTSREEILGFVYEEAPSVDNPSRTRPAVVSRDNGVDLHLPAFHGQVRALSQVIDVDYFVPGCPPTPALTREAVAALLEGRLPAKGTVLALDSALCESCPRRDSKPSDLSFARFRRPHQVLADPAVCLLAQGIVCMGPATRGGCGAQCIAGNMPCTGCFGPTSRVRDQGAKMLSSLCANLAPREAAEIDGVLDGLPDPVGTLYRYGLAGGLLRRRVDATTTT